MRRGCSCNALLFLLVVVPPVLLFAGALLVSLIPLPDSLDRSRNLVAAVGCGALGGVYLVVLVVALVWWVLSYSQSADPAFAWQGLEARSYALVGRQYHGRVHGRAVDVYYILPQRIHPGSLEIYLRTTFQARLTVSTGRPLHGCEGCRPLALGDPELAPLRILAREEAWARQVLLDPAGRAAVLRLMDGDSSGWREVYAQPGRLLLRRRPGAITPERVDRWFADLETLARVGEGLARADLLIEAPISEARGGVPGNLVTFIVVGALAVAALPACVVCLGGVLWAWINQAR